ncbi:MAG: acetate kinase [Clostridiales bacterium]|nr:acetate kinase [Clostridiales bacterium]
MKILVINAGSSSLKYQLIDMDNENLLAKGICEQIGDDNATFTHKVPADAAKTIKSVPHKMADHGEAIQLVLDTLVSKENGVIDSMDEIGAVGHRVLHGAEKFSDSVLVTNEVKETIKECFKFGPLHNPANLKGIEACEKIMDVPQIAVFDTGFHQTMPDYVYMYALPYEFYEKDGIRKYGFHGTSHRYVSGRCIELLGGKAEGTKIITCHLGNGSSISAVKDGKCFDTTMGLTPLEGIIMGTRCGSIDPAIVPTIMKAHNLSPDEMDSLMNKKSGMLGLAGTSDNRTIENMAKEGNERARLVESMLCHQLTKYIGGFAAAMGGVDAIVFTGGIGENNPQYRTRVAANIEFLGTKINEEANKLRGEEIEISTTDSKVKMFVIPTNEELVIARDTLEIVSNL